MMRKSQNDRVRRAGYSTPLLKVFSCGKDLIVTSENAKETGFEWDGEVWTKNVDESTVWN